MARSTWLSHRRVRPEKGAAVRDIGVLVSAGQQTDKDDETLYNYFCAALDRALTDTAQAH